MFRKYREFCVFSKIIYLFKNIYFVPFKVITTKYYFRSWLVLQLRLGWLSFGFLCSKFGLSRKESNISWAMLMRCCFWSKLSNFGTNQIYNIQYTNIQNQIYVTRGNSKFAIFLNTPRISIWINSVLHYIWLKLSYSVVLFKKIYLKIFHFFIVKDHNSSLHPLRDIVNFGIVH